MTSVNFIDYISHNLTDSNMKPFLSVFICCFLYFTPSLHAQSDYEVDGKTYSLKTEVKGELELLWNTIDGEYRYFLKKGDYIVELTDTKKDNRYQEEYKKVLEEQTVDAPVSTRKTKLNLSGLRHFFVKYNTLRDPNFVDEKESTQLQLLLGGYLGATNSVHTENAHNEVQPVIGVELELVDPIKLKRHVAVIDLRHTFKGNDNPYSATQASMNYRFKFIKTEKFETYIGVKFAAFTYFNTEFVNSEGKIISDSGSSFSSPITFGIGAGYKLGKGYITFGYHDIVGLNVETNDEFPIDFSMGYKFRL